ncbi:MAG: helix-turn-helix transcriptional regulator [Verrucomicrobia bacterium]|nr:helix-turn-helix transcriptional regulator [Pseudomonadota bacterium]MBS0632634.1 helix-turn-helix transcriptional regulator [Verrucomicrobiota bacterium]
MAVNKHADVEREILRPLWKVHILHHAGEAPIQGHWMLEELREHGYRVSPGTLYPMLARLTRLGWLRIVRDPGEGVRYRLTPAGKKALHEVQARLRELLREAFPAAKTSARS